MKKLTYRWVVLSPIIFLVCSCITESKNWNFLEPIKIDHTIEFNLDSLTPPDIIYPQTIQEDGNEFISSINIINNTIKIFDFKTNSTAKTIFFNSDGPDKVTSLLSFHYINKDSILYLDQIGNLFLLDSNSSILNKWNAKDANEKGLPLFYDNILPIFGDFQNEIAFANYYMTQLDRKMFFVLNLKKNQNEYKVEIPEEFVNGFYGAGDFGNWNYVVNKNGVFINFPNIHEIFHYDLKLNLIQKIKPTRSEPLPTIINPLPKDFDLANMQSLNRQQIEEKLNSSYVYGYLLFDEKSKKFVRFLKYPIPSSNVIEPEILSNERKVSIFIYDEDFHLISEMRVPDKEYSIQDAGFFVKDGFLYLQKKSEDEDKMMFDAISLN